MKPVWLAGANGLIGNYLVPTAPRVNRNYFFNNSATSTAASGKAGGAIQGCGKNGASIFAAFSPPPR
jgi:hypothetical protein